MTLLRSIRFCSFVALGAIWYLSLYACKDGSRATKETTDNRATMSYEEIAQTNASAALNQRADSALEIGEYHTALALYQRSMDSASVQADSFLYYDSKLDIASVYDRLGEPKKAIEITEQTVSALMRSGDSSRIGRAYNALAGFYGKAMMPEQSLAASLKGFQLLKRHGSPIERCASYNQMAFIYSDQGNWASALPLLDTALQLMEASGVLDQRPGMRLNLGNCHRNLGNWSEARRYLEAAAAEADSLHQAHILARTLERLSQVAEATGDPASALRLFQRAKTIRDSLFTESKAKSLQELEVKYQTREKEQELALLRANEHLKTSQRNLLLLGIFSIATLMGLGLYLQRLKLRNIRHTLAQKQQEMAEFVALLMAKNAQLGDLGNNQEQPVQTSTEHADADNIPTESVYNDRILTESDWELFKKRFERLYPGFILRLRSQFPEMSNGEERLFLLIKINLNGQEIANTLGITFNAVKKSRQRLRKRLELSPEEDLEVFVQGF